MSVNNNMILNIKRALKRFTRRIFSIRIFGVFTINDLVENLEKMNDLKKSGLMFEIHLTDHCNLNCKGCSHFSPISDKKFLSIDAFERDIKRISEILSNEEIRRIRLLGGEPLLHPQVIQIIMILREYLPSIYVELVTNGILLDSQPQSFWNTCSKNNIVLIITRYPISLNYEALVAKGKLHNVSITVFPQNNYKAFRKIVYDVKGSQNAYISHLFCFVYGYACQLYDGRLYPCAPAAYSHYLNKEFILNLIESSENSIDIFSVNSKKEIFDFISHQIPFCKYCNIKAQTMNEKWEHSKKELTEWT